MTNTTYQLEDFAVPLPITQAARTIAQEFANQQTTPEKAEQVRLNTIAVCVVNDYLQMMDIATAVQGSDSWNPVIRLCANVADLEIICVGRLECRPVTVSNPQVCIIPPETWEERIGYVAIQIDESLLEAKFLGFVPTVSTEELPLSQLLSPEAFIDHLEQLRRSLMRSRVNLSEWLIGTFESGWEPIEALWNLPELRPGYVFRSAETFERQEASITRAKLIDLGIQIANQPVTLIVDISLEPNQKTSIRLQLHPGGNQVYLPLGVQMTVIDQSGREFLVAQARSADNYIQLHFRGDSQELFSVRISLDDISITEHFVI